MLSSEPSTKSAGDNKTELSETAFRLAEKHYKLFRLDQRASKRRNVDDSDFSEVIDFHSLEANTDENQKMMRLVSEIEVPFSQIEIPSLSTYDEDNAACRNKRFRPELAQEGKGGDEEKNFISGGTTQTTRTQRCYTFDGVPGLLFFPSALNDEQQRYWCSQALNHYAQSPPFPNNLTTLDPALVTERYGGPHRRIETDLETMVDAKSSMHTTSHQQPCKEKMRWATLGFKYNWTTKSYTPSEYSPFPRDLSELIRKTFFTMLAPVATSALIKGDAVAVASATAKAVELAKGLQRPCSITNDACATAVTSATCPAEPLSSTSAVSLSAAANPHQLPAAAPITLLANQVAASHKVLSDEEILAALLSPTYEPQTAIVNYFPVGTMMCAHQDLSEPCLHRPLISISLGSSCIFLMGSTSRDDKPFAFMLRSGDIVAFTGPSRVAFHAVPRVLEDSPEHLVAYDKRMTGLRININVRQVYDESQPQLA